MNIVEQFENQTKTYELKYESINLIYFKTGNLFLPKIDKLCKLQVVFVESGSFTIEGDKYPIVLGEIKGMKIQIEVGSVGFDTQPLFIFSPEKNSWFIVSAGNFIFLDDYLIEAK